MVRPSTRSAARKTAGSKAAGAPQKRKRTSAPKSTALPKSASASAAAPESVLPPSGAVADGEPLAPGALPPPHQGPRDVLLPTGIPDVFVNRAGAHTDGRGVLLAWGSVRQRERDLDEEIIGERADTPAKFLKRVALDPRIPLGMRVDVAAKAAPYFDSKAPVRVQGSLVASGFDVEKLMSLPREKRLAFLATLQELGVDLAASAED